MTPRRVTIEYVWTGNLSATVNPNTVGRTVTAVAKRNGVCRPDDLVEVATPPDSEMHPLFNWDDAAAAHQHRLDQARRVIRSIRVVSEEVVETAPTFVHVSLVHDDGVTNGYMPFASATEEQQAQVLRSALGQLRGLQRRYESLRELAPIWTALDDIDGD